MAVVVLRREPHFAALEAGDVDITGGAGGLAGGLVDGGGEGGAVVHLVELPRSEVVGEDMEGEYVLDGEEGVMLVEEVAHSGIVDGADGDGHAAVDLSGEVSNGEVVVEGGEFRVFGQNPSNVEAICGGGEEEEEE